jgi:hypothetical protein
VRARVTEDRQRLRVFLGQNPERPALAKWSVEVNDLTIDFNCDCVPKQPRPDRCDDVARQSAFGSFTGGAVGEPQRQHFLV